MQIGKALILCCSLLMLSCQEVHHTPKPDNLIPEDKMVRVLVDMAKINAAININPEKYADRGAVGKELLFKKYNIDSLQLVQSNAYYAEHFNINLRIYEKVVATLQKQNDSIYGLDKKQSVLKKEDTETTEEKEELKKK